MKFQPILFATALSLFSLAAHAENVIRTECDLKGKIELHAPTQIVCFQDLIVDDGTEIITNGYPLDLVVVGNTHLEANSEAPHWTIKASDSPTELSAAGPITISARTGSGELLIENADGPVHIELTSAVRDYDQIVKVTEGTPVDTVLNGEDLTLVGPDHRLPIN